jgi:hypothetical protein
MKTNLFRKPAFYTLLALSTLGVCAQQAQAVNIAPSKYVPAQLSAVDFKTKIKLAGDGNAQAQFELGSIYSIGDGVTQDYTEGFYWYEKAAEQGSVYAQHNVALMYEKGAGVVPDYSKAVEWYKKAVASDYADSQLNLGVMYGNGTGVPRNPDKAIELFKLAAKQGNKQAQYNLGVVYNRLYSIK